MKLQFQSAVCLLLMYAPIAMVQHTSRQNSNKLVVGGTEVYANPSQLSHVNDMPPTILNNPTTAVVADGFGVTINDGFYNSNSATNAMNIKDGFFSPNLLKTQYMKTANSVTDILGAKGNEGFKHLTAETSALNLKHRSSSMSNSQNISNNAPDKLGMAFNAGHNDASIATIGSISNDKLSGIELVDSQSSNITATAINNIDNLAMKGIILKHGLLNSQPIKRVSGSIRHVLKGTVVGGFLSSSSNVNDVSVNGNAVVDSGMDLVSSSNGNVQHSEQALSSMDTGNTEYGASVSVSKSSGIEKITNKTVPIVYASGLNNLNKTIVKIKIRQPQTVSELIRLVGLDSKYISNQFGATTNEHRVGNDIGNKIRKKQNDKMIKETHNIELSVPNLSVSAASDIQVIVRNPKNLHYSAIDRTDEFATSSISNKQNSKKTKSFQTKLKQSTNVHYPVLDTTDGFFNSNNSNTQRSIKSKNIKVVDKKPNAVPVAVDPTDGFVSTSSSDMRKVTDTRRVEVRKNKANHISNGPSNVQTNNIFLNPNTINKQLQTNTQTIQTRLSPNARVLIPSGNSRRRGVSNVLPAVISFGNRPRYTIGTKSNGVIVNSSGSRIMPLQASSTFSSGSRSGQALRRRSFRPESSTFYTRGRSTWRFPTESSIPAFLTDVPDSVTHMRRGMPVGISPVPLPSIGLPVTGGRGSMFRIHRTDMPGRGVGVGTGSSRRFDGSDSIFTNGMRMPSSRMRSAIDSRRTTGIMSNSDAFRFPRRMTSAQSVPTSGMMHTRSGQTNMPRGSTDFGMPRGGELSSSNTARDRRFVGGMSRVDGFSRRLSRNRFDTESSRISESLPGGGFGDRMVRSDAFRGGTPRRDIFGDAIMRGTDFRGAMVGGSGSGTDIPRGSIFGSASIRDDIPIGIGFGTLRLSGPGFRRFPV